MLIRKFIYQWTCNKCKKKTEKKFNVYSYEEFPLLNDPLEGWVKLVTPKGEEHWCSDCVKKLTK